MRNNGAARRHIHIARRPRESDGKDAPNTRVNVTCGYVHAAITRGAREDSVIAGLNSAGGRHRHIAAHRGGRRICIDPAICGHNAVDVNRSRACPAVGDVDANSLCGRYGARHGDGNVSAAGRLIDAHASIIITADVFRRHIDRAARRLNMDAIGLTINIRHIDGDAAAGLRVRPDPDPGVIAVYGVGGDGAARRNR